MPIVHCYVAAMFFFTILVTIILHDSVSLDNPIIELSGAVLEMYKNPDDCRSKDLMEAGRDYLYHLINLKEDAKSEKKASLKELKDVYLEGNPPLHLRNIPWGKLIEQYDWNHVHVNEFFDIIEDTRTVWKECLGILEKHKQPDEIL